MQKNWRIAWAAPLLVLLLLPSFALADGKVFSNAIAKVNIPDQSAILCFDGQTERLIISTAYEAQGTSFAWVVPTPAVPKVEAVSPGIIPTLRLFCRPKIEQRSPDARVILLLIWTALALCLATTVRRNAIACAVLVLWATLPGLPWGLSANAKAGGDWMVASDGVQVQVHSQSRIGSYDVSVVSASTAEALTQWLDANGYKVDSAVLPVLSDYIREGWCFTAYRLHRDPDNPTPRTHPLSFTFPAAKAVYPMRLTGIGNGRLSLDLFILGAKEAQLEGFQRNRVLRVKDAVSGEGRGNWDLRLLHPKAREVVLPYGVLTQLSVTLPPAQMKSDLYPSWREARPYRPTLYTRDAADGWALGVGATALLGFSVLFVAVVLSRTRRARMVALGSLFFLGIASIPVASSFAAVHMTRSGGLSSIPLILALTLTATGYWFFSMPGEDEKPVSGRFLFRGILAVIALSLATFSATRWGLHGKVPGNILSNPRGAHVARQLLCDVANRRLGDNHDFRRAPLADAQKAFRDAARQLHAVRENNPYTDEPFREEDSPGNYVIERIGDRNAIYFYDLSGFKVEFTP